MTLTTEHIMTIIGMVSGFFTFWMAFSSRLVTSEADIKNLKEAVTELKADVKQFWRNMAKDASEILHHPNDARGLDELLERFASAESGGPPMASNQIDCLRARLWLIVDNKQMDVAERTVASKLLRSIEALYPEHRGINPHREPPPEEENNT